MSNRAHVHVDLQVPPDIVLVITCTLQATGNASTYDPVDEEKEAKWSAVKAQIEDASADV